MNIFYIDTCPVKAAQMQCDKHVVKMILESAQMLCAAHHVEGEGNVPYKLAHKNHPSPVWTRTNKKHYQWLWDHMMALGKEYTERYGKVPMTITKCAEARKNPPETVPNLDWPTPPHLLPDR